MDFNLINNLIILTHQIFPFVVKRTAAAAPRQKEPEVKVKLQLISIHQICIKIQEKL